MKSRSYLVFGLAIVIALIAATAFMADQNHTTSASDGGPAMALTVPGGDCEGTKCTVAEGAAFTLAVEIVEAPATGYILAQSFIDYGPDLVYKPTEFPVEEIIWPDCMAAPLRNQLGPTLVGHGCLTALFPPLPVSTFLGNYVEMSFNCSAATSSTEVVLLPVGDPVALTNGAAFKDDLNEEFTPKIKNVTINCGAGDTPVPTTPPPATTPPEATDTPTSTPVTPTATPRDQLCGDINDDGIVDSRDALWVLWFTADLVSELEKDGDVNGDGSVTSIDASLILQAEADLIESPCL